MNTNKDSAVRSEAMRLLSARLQLVLEDERRELRLYKAALTRAVSLPKGQLPHGEGYCSVMLNGQVVVREDKT